MRKLATILSFLPGAIALIGFLALYLDGLRQGVAYPFSFQLSGQLVIMGVLLLVLAVVTRRETFVGGVLFIGFGALLLLFLLAQLLSELDPLMFLVFMLPFCLLNILAGILNVKFGMESGGKDNSKG